MPRSESSRSNRRDSEPPDRSLPTVAVFTMTIAALVCFALGIINHGATWRSAYPGAMLSMIGICYVVIALFDVEWLERIVGLRSWPGGLFGRGESLSESSLFGERGARTVYLVLGLLMQVGGGLLSLRMFVL